MSHIHFFSCANLMKVTAIFFKILEDVIDFRTMGYGGHFVFQNHS